MKNDHASHGRFGIVLFLIGLASTLMLSTLDRALPASPLDFPAAKLRRYGDPFARVIKSPAKWLSLEAALHGGHECRTLPVVGHARANLVQ